MLGNIKFKWFLLAPIVLSVLAACASTGTLENTSSGTLNNTSSTLQINTSDVATGTGFLFSSADYVITSYHVVRGAKSIRVRMINGDRIDATVALKDTNNDIAILKLSQSPTSRQNIITLGDSSSVKTGDRVFTYGFPLVDLLGDAEPRYSEGFINSLSGISNDPRLFQVSIPIQPGNSGGPVFNEKGELIAIATSSIDDDKTKKIFGSSPQNVNFAIKSSYLESILPALPDAFIRDKGIVVVPAEEVGFKERVKSDIVLVEAVPEFKPTVVKSDNNDDRCLAWDAGRCIAWGDNNDDRCIAWSVGARGRECSENQRDGLPGEGFCVPHAYNNYNEMGWDYNFCTQSGHEWQ